MKYLYLFAILLVGYLSAAQVGINTSTPQADLDVNGVLRVRSLGNAVLSGMPAVKLVGVDEDGNLVPVSMGKNVEIQNNEVVSKKRVLEFGDLPNLIIPQNGRIDNLDIVIFPGDRNHGKSIIRVEIPNPTHNSPGGNGNPSDIEISGIKAAPDGTQIWFYPLDGDIEFLPLNGNSNLENQIQDNSHMVCKQFEMIRMVYDGTTQKWVIMKHHG
jgi:hypothetical protein